MSLTKISLPTSSSSSRRRTPNRTDIEAPLLGPIQGPTHLFPLSFCLPADRGEPAVDYT